MSKVKKTSAVGHSLFDIRYSKKGDIDAICQKRITRYLNWTYKNPEPLNPERLHHPFKGKEGE